MLAGILLVAGCAGEAIRAPDTCESALDGECDEPQYCAAGTDTTDCGDDSCASANDGECDEPQYCDFGTDTTDCRAARLCEPQCGARVCGDEPACGTSCGTCIGNQSCNAEGQCIDNACTPDCAGRACGADPVCGRSCGTCGGTEVCDTGTGQCAAPCEAGRTLCNGTCVDTSSDPNHCGGCDACPAGNLCENGSCTQPPEDCRQEPCSGLTYCDLATGQCLPGCSSTEQCGANEVCDLSAHTCNCTTGYVRCNGTCVEDDDLPDLNYEDANCDGIDGNAANAIFVAPGGNDNGAGTMAQPLATIQAGMLAAQGRPRAEVFIGAGVYTLTESLQLRDQVSLYGGYDAGNGWARSANAVTEIQGPSPVLEGNSLDGPLAIQGLKIVGLPGDLAPGESAYGIVVRAGSGTLFIQGNEIMPGPGASGTPGADGSPGSSGTPGGNGANGRTGAGGNSCGRGGGGGTSYSTGGSSEANGRPGQPGEPTGRGGARGLGGSGCGSNKQGDDGGDGMPGADGAPGPVVSDPMGSVDGGRFSQSQGNDGSPGESGGGGGGGGGGSYCRTNGGGGGGGGSGGCGGGPGEGGMGGGGSFCIFMTGGALETGQNRFMPSAGGEGGDGGTGALGGNGAGGGNGGSGASSGANYSGRGGAGGNGAAGGAGGPGSGGPGGPSVGLYISNGAHTPANDQLIGAQGGAGGAGGNGAPTGPTGATYRVYCESGSCTTIVN